MAISLSIPGHVDHLPVLRATAASVAARARLTLDQLEDVRLAVDEAASTLLSGRPPAVEMDIDPAVIPLTVTLTATPAAPISLEPDGFTWTVIDAMTEAFDVTTEHDEVSLRMRFAGVAE
ncbi:hypothetical protein [Euzebya tangerina]|uniref:hypothetical protein n=1 Tax=Euzebya tangerina TaxID=591198 RepID=UPI000E3160D1|nr:hypothetical protein [Euzebya tangerina]